MPPVHYPERKRGPIHLRRLLSPGPAILVSITLIVVAMVVFTSLGTVNQQSAQLEIEMRGMGQAYVNIWLDPEPPSASGTTVITQVIRTGGMPMAVSSAEFRLGRGEAEPTMVEVGVAMEYDGNNLAERGRFTAELRFPEPGDWWIEVTVRMGSEESTVRLPITVAR